MCQALQLGGETWKLRCWKMYGGSIASWWQLGSTNNQLGVAGVPKKSWVCLKHRQRRPPTVLQNIDLIHIPTYLSFLTPKQDNKSFEHTKCPTKSLQLVFTGKKKENSKKKTQLCPFQTGKTKKRRTFFPPVGWQAHFFHRRRCAPGFFLRSWGGGSRCTGWGRSTTDGSGMLEKPYKFQKKTRRVPFGKIERWPFFFGDSMSYSSFYNYIRSLQTCDVGVLYTHF